MKSTLILTSDIVLALDGISVWPWQKVVIPTTRTRRGCVSTMPAPTFRLTLEKENNRWRVFIQKETEKPTTACLMMTMSSYDIIIFLCSIFRLARSFLFHLGIPTEICNELNCFLDIKSLKHVFCF